MKDLYEGVADILLNDTDLKGLVKYTSAEMNIRRGYMPTGKWNSLVIFYFQPEYVLSDFTSRIRTVPLLVRVYDRTNDLVVDEIGERIILLLDKSDLTVKGKVNCFDVSYAGELISSSWNDDLKAYEKVLRFVVVFRVDGVVGNSGLPTRRRKSKDKSKW